MAHVFLKKRRLIFLTFYVNFEFQILTFENRISNVICVLCVLYNKTVRVVVMYVCVSLISLKKERYSFKELTVN